MYDCNTSNSICSFQAFEDTKALPKHYEEFQDFQVFQAFQAFHGFQASRAFELFLNSEVL